MSEERREEAESRWDNPRREKVEEPDFTDEDLAIMDEVWREIAERGWTAG